MHNSGDEENNTVADDIDIVDHKIKIDNWSYVLVRLNGMFRFWFK